MRTNEARKHPWICGWSAITLVAALTAWAWAPPANAARPDVWITTKVKLALLTTEGLGAVPVSVDTVNGEVTLHGKVNSPEERQKAESVAKGVEGVGDVHNLLQVVPERHEERVQRSDEQIKKQVETTLKAAPALKDSGISVRSVNNGVVLLGGHTKTLVDHLNAVETAASVPGVRRVASEIQSSDELGDAEIWREGRHTASQAAHGVGDTARDLYITSAIKLRLLADGNTPALDINVDTRNRIVTLFGIVPSEKAKLAAAADARVVSGVKQVKNELQVVPKPQQKAVKAGDEQLEHEVKQAFDTREDLKGIHVEVKNCIARLTGTVPSGTQRLEAAVVARSTQGVCSVQDDLRIAG